MLGNEGSLMPAASPEVEAAFARIHADVKAFESLDTLPDPSERKQVLDDNMQRFNDSNAPTDVRLALAYLAGKVD